MIDLLTGTPFAASQRLHHREDEVALEPSSNATSRRALLGVRGQMFGRVGGCPARPDWVSGSAISNLDYSAVLMYDMVGTSVGFDVEYESDFTMSNGSTARFMNLWNPDGSGFGYGIIPGNSSYIFGSCSQKRFVTYASELKGRHSLKFNYMNSRDIHLDGVKKAEFDAVQEYTATRNANLYLWANQNGNLFKGYYGYDYSAKIYSVKITDGNTIVHDCVPAIGDDGNGALWDTVTSSYMPNVGTLPLEYGWDE